jgi:sugar transferase EpsL
VKRLIDIVGAGLMLLVLGPLMAILVVCVRIAVGKPVLFRQVRPGLGSRPFNLIKFRTMRDARGEHGELLPDHERLTPFGAWLRRASLDELPELFNVLRGEMSLVGPRPLLVEYLRLYSADQARRHNVRPGITGWAQVNGRNAISWEEKLALDVWYVDNHSLWLDLKILWLTLFAVVRATGITQAGHVTTEKFSGSGQ